MHKYHGLIIGQVIGSLGQLRGVRCIQMKKDHALAYIVFHWKFNDFVSSPPPPIQQPKPFFSIPQYTASLDGPTTLYNINIIQRNSQFDFFRSARGTDSIQTILEKSKIENTKSIRRYIRIYV